VSSAKEVKDMHYLEQSIRHLGYFIKTGQFRRAAHLVWHRWKYGCDEVECWSLDVTLATFILPRLQYYRKFEGEQGWEGVPGGVDSREAWLKIIDKMIYAMEACVCEDASALTPEIQRKHRPKTYRREEILKENEKVAEGLRLFGKYFQALWT
jgi:hypothetical protein